jgi:hypothetical protein
LRLSIVLEPGLADVRLAQAVRYYFAMTSAKLPQQRLQYQDLAPTHLDVPCSSAPPRVTGLS